MDRSTAPSNSAGSQVGSYVEAIPIVTKGIIGLCVLIHIGIFVGSLGLQNFAISADYVITRGEYYRIVTSAFTHVNLMHIGMNMMSMFSLGSSLEMQYGSLAFLFVGLWGVLLIGVIYVSLSWIGAKVMGDESWMYMNAVGYSGVLFCYAILESFHTTATTRSLCGFCDVPARMYPFILLVGISVLMPGISFLGHVSGVIFGLLLVYGPATLLLPSQAMLEYLEGHALCGCLTKLNSYCRVTGKSCAVDGLRDTGVVGACTTLGNAILSVIRFLMDLIFTVLAVIGCPAESIAARVRSLIPSFGGGGGSRSSSASGGGGEDGADVDVEAGAAAAGTTDPRSTISLPQWSSAQQYTPVATQETEPASTQSSEASESTPPPRDGADQAPASKADMLAAAEKRLNKNKY